MFRYFVAALRAVARALSPTADQVSRWIQSKLTHGAQLTIALIHRLQEFVEQLREFIARWSVAPDC